MSADPIFFSSTGERGQKRLRAFAQGRWETLLSFDPAGSIIS
jgi:hypothetical protein